VAKRLWRLRKLHQYVDAELADDRPGLVEIRFLYNGALAYTRQWDTIALAIEEASLKRAELERDGWMFHW